MKIGIIGRGFVGGSIEKLLVDKSEHHVEAFDVNDGELNEGYERVVKDADLLYVAVPTPMDGDGKCYTGILEESLRLVDDIADCGQIVMIKSTMVPGTSERLKSNYKNIVIVTNPEFLTERNAYEDLCRAKQHVLGGVPEESKEMIRNYHESLWGDCKCIFVSNTEAELIKYLINTYLSVKVSFANHIYQLANSLGVDYSTFIESAIESDSRIETTHWQVPGPDGRLGFGGKCFPKDLNGMISLFNEHGLECPLLKAAWDYNLLVRNDKDWERIYGATL